MVDISVIVPVYNVEDYLSECLNSLINQSFKNIEIICIDDGSSDNSLKILFDYANVDDRIKIVSQKNQGLGATRNNGLKIASGKYVFFIDSDDYIDISTLEKLHDNAISNNSDVVLYKFINFDNGKNLHKRAVAFKIDDIFGDIDYSNFSFTYDEVKQHVLNSAYSACLKLYKKEFLDSFDDFYFPEKLSFEDVPFHVKVLLRASRLTFVPEFLYYYRSNPNSILNTSDNGWDIFKIVNLVENFLRDNNYYHEFEDEFIFFKIKQILMYLISTDSNDYFIKAKDELSKLEIKNEKIINKYILDDYNLVLNSTDFNDYLVNYYGFKNLKLENENKKLKKENKQLKQTYNQLISSKSWKITKPLRSLKKP